LCLVADFSERDDTGGNEKGFQLELLDRLKTVDHTASPANPMAIWSKILPSQKTACTMARGPSVLMQAPLLEGGYSPMTGRL
jgi:hypothetical protein